MLTLCVSLKLDQNKLYVVYSFPFQTNTTYYIERSYAVPEKKLIPIVLDVVSTK